MKASRGFPGCVPLLSGGAHQLRSKVHCPDRVVVCRALFINSRRYENFCLQRYHHVSPITASSQQSSVHDSVADLGMPATRQSSNVFLVACAATCLAALSRTAFSVLALPIFDQYGLPSHLLGRLQATLLTGYLVGQVRGQQ